MEVSKNHIDQVLDGIFYFFGFTENPAQKAAREVIDQPPAEKIKNDLRRVNRDYREQYLEMKKRALCVD